MLALFDTIVLLVVRFFFLFFFSEENCSWPVTNHWTINIMFCWIWKMFGFFTIIKSFCGSFLVVIKDQLFIIGLESCCRWPWSRELQAMQDKTNFLWPVHIPKSFTGDRIQCWVSLSLLTIPQGILDFFPLFGDMFKFSGVVLAKGDILIEFWGVVGAHFFLWNN